MIQYREKTQKKIWNARYACVLLFYEKSIKLIEERWGWGPASIRILFFFFYCSASVQLVELKRRRRTTTTATAAAIRNSKFEKIQPINKYTLLGSFNTIKK